MTFGDYDSEFGELARIVSDLSEQEPLNLASECVLCGADVLAQEEHRPECPYRRAVDWRNKHASQVD